MDSWIQEAKTVHKEMKQMISKPRQKDFSSMLADPIPQLDSKKKVTVQELRS